MDSKFLGLVVFLMMIFILFNEVINLTKFIVNYHNIKEITKLSRANCEDIYTEAETERFQLSKNLYSLLLPNDIFNSKLYIILLFIFIIMFFLYTSNVYIKYIYDNEYKLSYTNLYVATHILYFLACIIVFIIFRYAPWDEAGYLNYYGDKDIPADSLNKFNLLGMDREQFNNSLFHFVIGIMFIYWAFNQFYSQANINLGSYIIVSLYYLFAFYLLFNMMNIIGTFKNNRVPFEIETEETRKNNSYINWTADISYDSENFFYHKYLNYVDMDFWNTNKETNYTYKIHNLFIFKRIISLITIIINYVLLPILGICILIAFIGMIFNSNWEFYFEPLVTVYNILTPIIILCLLLGFIINNISLNTSFNKDVLFNVTNVYKYDLNKLNNIVTPYISVFNNLIDTTQRDDEEDEKATNYLYNIIIFNVIVSYLQNNINLITNETVKDNVINVQNLYSDKTYVNNLTLQFDKINRLDINNKDSFDEYYNKIMKSIFSDYISGTSTENFDNVQFKTDLTMDVKNAFLSKYKNILKGMVPNILDNISVNKLSYIIPEECFNSEFLKKRPYQTLKQNNQINMNFMEYVLDKDKKPTHFKIKCINVSTKKSYYYKIENKLIVDIDLSMKEGYTDDLKEFFILYLSNNMIYNIYKLFEIFDIDTYNNRIETYNKMDDYDESDRNKLLNHLVFLKKRSEGFSNIKPLEFMLKKSYKKSDISDPVLTKLYEMYPKENLYEILKAFISNMLDLHFHILLYEETFDNITKDKLFNIQIQPYFKAIIDRQDNMQVIESTNIYYIYCILTSKFKIKLDAKDNYLQNVIENNFHKINNTSMQVISLRTDTFKANDIDNIHKTNQMKSTNPVNDNNEISKDIIKTIENKANTVIRDNFIITYLVNFVILYITYSLIN